MAKSEDDFLGGISWEKSKKHKDLAILQYFIIGDEIKNSLYGARVAKKLIDAFEKWCLSHGKRGYYGEISKDNMEFQKLAEHYGAKKYGQTEKDYLYYKELRT